MTFSSQHHSFDISLAAEYGVECAILIHHFQHWIRINRSSNRNIKEGRCWTYQTRRDIQAHFPYWNYDKVKYLCEKLVEMEVLTTNNFNKNPIDKTLWYAFLDEKRFGVSESFSNNVYEGQKCPSKGKSAQGEGKSAQPIPDTIPNTKAQIREEHPPNPPKRGEAPKGAECEGYGPYVKLKKEDYENFCNEYGKQNIDSLIEELNDWISSGRGKVYKDYSAALRTWIKRRDWKLVDNNKSESNHYPVRVVEDRTQQSLLDPKWQLIKENQDWVNSFMVGIGNAVYVREFRVYFREKFFEVPEIPEAKFYYDSPGFRSCVQSVLEKLKIIDYTNKSGAVSCGLTA